MIIKHMSMANHLLKNNIHLKEIDRDKTDRSRLIFIFEDCRELKKALSEFKTHKKEIEDDTRHKDKNTVD